MKELIWDKYKSEEIQQAFDFCESYKNFLSECKTERECIKKGVELVKKHGYRNLFDVINQNGKLHAGDKVYAINSDKALVVANIGLEPLEKGLKIIGSHIDSPRLDLKATPVYEDSELCMLDTHYYGGIKKYQWVAMPIALHGVVVKKDGTRKDICIGENENECVFGITDLLPHLDKMDKDKKEIIAGEALNIMCGSMPAKTENKDEKNRVKKNILNLLKQNGIEEDDLFSAEIECVPAGKARDLGFDKSMIMAYGQDDRVCAYTSLMAQLEAKAETKTSVCLWVDKEEIGSVGSTGMKSKFFENIIAEIINLQEEYSELKLRRCLQNSVMLSSDVTAALDPNYPAVMNKTTDAELGKGFSFNKYTGYRGKYDANDANPEFIAKMRKIMDDNGIHYQATEMGKVDAGGGGTIAYIMASYGMNVIDAGVPILNMHAPWEISSKADVFETYKAYKTFINN